MTTYTAEDHGEIQMPSIHDLPIFKHIIISHFHCICYRETLKISIAVHTVCREINKLQHLIWRPKRIKRTSATAYISTYIATYHSATYYMSGISVVVLQKNSDAPLVIPSILLRAFHIQIRISTLCGHKGQWETMQTSRFHKKIRHAWI